MTVLLLLSSYGLVHLLFFHSIVMICICSKVKMPLQKRAHKIMVMSAHQEVLMMAPTRFITQTSCSITMDPLIAQVETLKSCISVFLCICIHTTKSIDSTAISSPHQVKHMRHKPTDSRTIIAIFHCVMFTTIMAFRTRTKRTNSFPTETHSMKCSLILKVCRNSAISRDKLAAA